VFEIFERVFSCDPGNAMPSLAAERDPEGQLARRFGGCTFERGLYRILRPIDVSIVKELVDAAFPSLAKRTRPFSTDLLGRIFATDSGRMDDGTPKVLMLDPGTGEALEIPATIESFHDGELIEYKDAALASNFYEAWLNRGGCSPEATQCIGYKVPLFLGGKDEASNLEIVDLNVYWTLTAQLLAQARRLQIGAKIGTVEIG